MKRLSLFVLSGVLFLNAFIASAQISTSSGGSLSVLANAPTSNTNVGIGTNSPAGKLAITGGLPNGQVFTSWSDSNSKNLVFNAGSIVDASTGARMFKFYDWPTSNLTPKPLLFIGLEDRNDFGRYRYLAETGGYTEMSMADKAEQEIFKINEDGNNKVFMHLPKPNSRIVIAGFGDYLPEHKFVVRGSAKIEGNILTDANIGIGSSNFVDGADTFRLSVKGAIRADRVKVYTTWADFVFEKNYKLPSLKEVEKHIKKNGHLKDIPSAEEVEAKGIELGEMNKLLLQKVEELTLYLIEMNKDMQLLKEQIKK